MLVTGCVTLSDLLNLSVPRFPHLEDGKHSYLIALRGTKLIFVELLKQFWEHMSAICFIESNQISPRLSWVGRLDPDGPAATSAPSTWALTWSSRRSSQKAGMYLAHSTRTSSCSFMDSHTSVMLAIFLARMSPLIPEMGEVICRRQENAGNGGFSLKFLSLAQSPFPRKSPVC